MLLKRIIIRVKYHDFVTSRQLQKHFFFQLKLSPDFIPRLVLNKFTLKKRTQFRIEKKLKVTFFFICVQYYCSAKQLLTEIETFVGDLCPPLKKNIYFEAIKCEQIVMKMNKMKLKHNQSGSEEEYESFQKRMLNNHQVQKKCGRGVSSF